MSDSKLEFTEPAQRVLAESEREYAADIRERALAIAELEHLDSVTVAAVQRALSSARATNRRVMTPLLTGVALGILTAVAGALLVNEAGAIVRWLSSPWPAWVASAANVVQIAGPILVLVYWFTTRASSRDANVEASLNRTAEFIAAWMDLEALLATVGDRSASADTPTASLIQHLEKDGKLSGSQTKTALAILDTRNQVVHGGRVLSGVAAGRTLQSIRRLRRALAEVSTVDSH